MTREQRLAELIVTRARLVVEEKERRKSFKHALETYDEDIKKYAADITAGQVELFPDEEDAK